MNSITENLCALRSFNGGLNASKAKKPGTFQCVTFLCLDNQRRSPFGEQIATKLDPAVVFLGVSTSSGGAALSAAVDAALRQKILMGAPRAVDWSDSAASQGEFFSGMAVRRAHKVKPHSIGRPDVRTHIARLSQAATRSMQHFLIAIKCHHASRLHILDAT